MTAFIDPWMDDRKRRLFAAACCRRFAHLLPDPRSPVALDLAFEFAGGRLSEEDRQRAADDAFDAHIEMHESRLVLDPPIPWSRPAELLSHAAALAVSLGIYYAEDAANYTRW